MYVEHEAVASNERAASLPMNPSYIIRPYTMKMHPGPLFASMERDSCYITIWLRRDFQGLRSVQPIEESRPYLEGHI